MESSNGIAEMSGAPKDPNILKSFENPSTAADPVSSDSGTSEKVASCY